MPRSQVKFPCLEKAGLSEKCREHRARVSLISSVHGVCFCAIASSLDITHVFFFFNARLINFNAGSSTRRAPGQKPLPLDIGQALNLCTFGSSTPKRSAE